jgi:hypothetical protein
MAGRARLEGKGEQRSRRLMQTVVRAAVASPCCGAGEGALQARERGEHD